MANCTFHPDKASVAFCRTCGAALCADCTRDVRGLIYCEGCLARRMEGAPAAAPATGFGTPPPPPPVTPSSPNVGLATFLGFIPGVGAMYNGQIKKAFAHVGVFAALVTAADYADIFGFFIFLFLSYMVLDANRTAKARLAGTTPPDYLGLGALVGEDTAAPGVRTAAGQAFQAAGSALDAAAPGPKVPVGATVLIILGTLFLFSNFGLFQFHWFNTTWPLGLVLIGAYLGSQRWNNSPCPCTRCRMNGMLWPVLLVTFGTLVFIRHLVYFRGVVYLGVLLIVFGAMRLMQSSSPTDGHIQPGEIPSHEIPPVPPAAQPPQS